MQRRPRAHDCLKVAAVATVSMRALLVLYFRGSSFVNQGIRPHWPTMLNQTTYTVEQVAERAKSFLFARYQQAHPDGIPGYFLGYRVCGYSASCRRWATRSG